MKGTIAGVFALCEANAFSRKLLLLSAAALSASILPSTGQAQATSTQGHQKLAEAFAQDTAGYTEQAVAAAEKLLASGTLSRIEQADALDLEGMCYQQLDQTDKAIHALESAQALLTPGDTRLEAAVLDNLGRVYVARGDLVIAEHLYERAFRLFEAADDHGGVARVSSNQAKIALSEKKNRQARKYLERSDHEAKLATDLDKDDLGALASMHAWLALNEGKAYDGVEAYRKALRLWTEFHGEHHPLTAWGTFLLGQAEALDGQWAEGTRTMEKGLALIKDTVGDRCLRYLAGETAYARVLDQVGESVRAAQLRRDVKKKQAEVMGTSCGNCTISVVALQ